MRVTQKILDQKLHNLNELTGESPDRATVYSDGARRYNIGTYVIGYNAGNVRLERIDNDAGGTHEVTGFTSMRGLYYMINAFMKGYLAGLNKCR